jgi:hypothetical protein
MDWGKKGGCVETIKTIKSIRWNFDGKFKVSGIKYDLNKTEFWTDNFKEKLITIKKTSGQLDITKSFTTREGDSIKIFSLTYFGTILNSPPRSST